VQFLLDAATISDLIRNPNGGCATQVAAVGEGNICTSIIVACELRYGASKRKSPQFAQRIEGTLSLLKVLPFQAPADDIYGQLRTKLEAQGSPIGANDLLIASHALALGSTLVTGNEREFRRVSGLKVDNWIR
jgi:tRNA(fMet)-specific endonuclease VapC